MARWAQVSRRLVAGTLVVAGGLTAAVLIGAAAFISRHVTAQTAPADTAAAEMDRQKGRFAGQTPLREVRDGREPLAHPTGGRRSEWAQSLHALISDPRSSRLVRVDVPLAVLRVAKRGGFRYLGELTPGHADTEFEQDRIDLQLDEIDGHGAILILDHSHGSGARIVMWVE